MQFGQDNYQYYEENSSFEVSLQSAIGTREDQQDSAAVLVREKDGIIVICDGMGGHEGGKTASATAAEGMKNKFINRLGSAPVSDVFLRIIDELDSEVMNLKNSEGMRMRAGTTMVAAYFDGNIVHWASVGDSRIYIIRGEEMVQVTTDHNYEYRLERLLEEGKISIADYREKMKEGEALISFLGVGGIELVDINMEPFYLYPGDKILLTTDGLYKAIDDEVIRRIIENFRNIKDATDALISRAKKATRDASMDNTTIALIHIK